MRSSFKGALRCSLITVPFKAFTTTPSAKQKPGLNQLHSTCKSRMRQKLTCPCCGDVDRSEIEKGFEFAKDQYVIINEKQELHSESKDIEVSSFVPASSIPAHFRTEKNYVLAPEDIGAKAYHLLVAAMLARNVACFGTATIMGKEQQVLISVVDGALMLTILHYADSLRGADALDLGNSSHTNDELELALRVVDTITQDKVELETVNPYNARMRALVEAKVDGKEIVSPPAAEEDEAPVINLMDALQRSLEAMDGPKQAKSATSRRKKVTA